MPVLGSTFPPESAEWTVFVAALVLLVGPVVAVLALAGASLAIVLVGKTAASSISGRLAGFSAPEVRLVFGLTIAQAAATLAAVTIGTEVGIFDRDLLSATLVVVLVTVIVAGIVTRSAARTLADADP